MLDVQKMHGVISRLEPVSPAYGKNAHLHWLIAAFTRLPTVPWNLASHSARQPRAASGAAGWNAVQTCPTTENGRPRAGVSRREINGQGWPGTRRGAGCRTTRYAWTPTGREHGMQGGSLCGHAASFRPVSGAGAGVLDTPCSEAGERWSSRSRSGSRGSGWRSSHWRERHSSQLGISVAGPFGAGKGRAVALRGRRAWMTGRG